MPSLSNGVSALIGDITITKRTGTVLTLATDSTYVDKDIEFTIGASSAAAAASTATADANVEGTDDGNAGGVNISDAIGSKQTTEPSSGYYIRIKADGSGRSKVTTPGWLDAGDLPQASTTKTVFFPVEAGSAEITGTNTVTPTAVITGSCVTLSVVNNGISVTATGGGTATASASATATSEGYIPDDAELDSTTISAEAATTSSSAFISGVTLTAPESGTRSFSVTVPNGESTQTVTFTVDSDGNVTIS